MKILPELLFVLVLITGTGLSITLDGTWTGTIKYCGVVTNDDCTTDISFPATVPGGIYSDLRSGNLIPDNFRGSNDLNNRWVGNQTVTYTQNFDVNGDLLKAPKLILIFHGLDTFATIYLNGQEIGKASNMFLRYSFDVTRELMEGSNVLKVVFVSAVKVAEDTYARQASNYTIPPVCVPREYNGECHVNHIRKMQASFSWDWGPAFPSMGIWRSVELIPVNEVFITDVTTDIHKEESTWKVIVTLYLEVTAFEQHDGTSCYISSRLRITKDRNIDRFDSIVLNSNVKHQVARTILDVPTDLVEKWWPNGYGKQNLYKLTVTVTTPGNVIQKEVRVGFRTVELVQQPLKKGLSFYFRINGIPIFAKGSNFIPASIFPELSAKEETIRHLLASTKETHMNMLRIWGGGTYESDLFYDLADEYGIMIWQDFMFACAMYPVTEEFLQSINEEVTQNVRRLKNHPSIVIWAGNNENEAALYGNWYGTGSAQIYKDDYIKLYVDLIKKEVEVLDNTRPFVVSSPSNGLYTEEYNYVGVNPYLTTYGDVHYYNYIKNSWDINQYPRARFSSEYGFQSLPSIYTIAPASEKMTDLHINSDFMRHRQHLPLGNVLMTSLISRNLAIPQTNDSIRDFIDFIYLSQINQAVSQRIQTEFYRQSMSEVNSIGEGMTMGALYWQLNDVWQAPSWSSIDIEGRWKMLHYYAMEFFAPIIVTSHLSKANDLSLYVVSDKLDPVQDITLEINVYKWNEMIPIHTKVYEDITIDANKAKLIDSLWLDAFLSEVNCGSLSSAKKHCIVTLTLKDKDGSRIAPVNYVYPTAIKNVNLPVADTTIKITNSQLPGKYANYPDFEIELTTDNVTLFVWLEAGNVQGRFSENGFHMFDKKKRIVFHANEATTAEILQENLILTTLSDLYNPNRRNHTRRIISHLNMPLDILNTAD